MPRTRTTLAEDFAAARAVILTLADRSSELLSRVRVPGVASPLPGWTAGDVSVHLGLACTAYAAAATGDFGILDEIGAANAATAKTSAAKPAAAADKPDTAVRATDFAAWLAALPPRADLIHRISDLNALTLAQAAPEAHFATPARIRAGADAIVAATAGCDPAEPRLVPWFGEDTRLQLGTVVGLFLSETLLHTLDVARASHQKWPIPSGTARLIISLAFPELMPRTVDRERTARMEAAVRLHVRGGTTIGIDVHGGEVRAVRDPGPGRTDCHISMDPVGFLLAASGRASQNRQIAAGRMIPYGRKPWLAPQVARLFVYP
ncbi:SCP2 sterol-binding domain-containing protein [Catenulispora subtropica]|uniref:SCP2 domain-containing protein n=1 Tax=Catenulispora subtropica TaxID=450798 RepID=A0ABN2QL59_9ACTN